MLDRRRLLRLGGITAGSVVGGAALLSTVDNPVAASGPAAPTGHGGHHPGDAPPAAPGAIPTGKPFSRRMPVPPELTPERSRSGVDLYRIPIRPATAEFLPGHPTPVRTYAGRFVGPTIRARTGRPVLATFTNQLDVPSNVHLHGGHIAQKDDGHPMDVIAPGQSRTYEYPNRQQGATLWYHDHAHHLEADNVYHGLSAFYIIEDDAERDLGLPSGAYDIPIMLRDCQLDANGALVYPGAPWDRTTILANGVITPHFPVAARKYRFRLLSSALERTFRLTLGGAEMVQIASDGGLLPAPVPRDEIVLGSAERTDVVIDFSRHPVGAQLVLYDVTGPVLRFDVTRKAADDSRVPDRLRPLPALPPATVERNLTFRFDGDVGLVSGQAYDPNRVDFRVRRGTTEIWRITNEDVELAIPHTFHMHLEQFRVLDRDGKPPTLDDAGRKDTVFVGPGETVRVQARFTDYLGIYPYHCHYLDHSAAGMMAQMEIVE